MPVGLPLRKGKLEFLRHDDNRSLGQELDQVVLKLGAITYKALETASRTNLTHN